VIAVADEGPGFDAEEASRVFDRFYRGHSARSREGAGLGLSIVAALARAHGGIAAVESAPGAGTTFSVELPLHAAANLRGAPPLPVAASIPATASDPAGEEGSRLHAGHHGGR
jgi:two-component system OmpR family sensor kinase